MGPSGLAGSLFIGECNTWERELEAQGEKGNGDPTSCGNDVDQDVRGKDARWRQAGGPALRRCRWRCAYCLSRWPSSRWLHGHPSLSRTLAFQKGKSGVGAYPTGAPVSAVMLVAAGVNQPTCCPSPKGVARTGAAGAEFHLAVRGALYDGQLTCLGLS